LAARFDRHTELQLPRGKLGGIALTTSDVSTRTTRFPEFSVSGSPTEIGIAIGEQFRDTIRGLSELVLDRFNRSAVTPVSVADANAIAAGAVPFAEAYIPDAVTELRATAKAAGVPFERVMLINVRSMLSAGSEGCTSVMIGAQASESGVGIAGQNWDNDPAMEEFSAVITRRPEGKPAFMSWCQPGVIAYMGFSDAGFGVCMNALNGPSRRSGVGWYFLVRSIYEERNLSSVVSRFRGAKRAMTANAAMITPEGPADLEITLDAVEVLQASETETLVHTNHCVHQNLLAYNESYADSIFGQSFDRKSRAEELLSKVTSRKYSVDDVKSILADRQGYPTSINRYPNDNPSNGWQRSVISMIVEPDAGRMYVTRGNPGDNPYELYKLVF
jgi:isopenicillin-N N-acyltransferase-like protein